MSAADNKTWGLRFIEEVLTKKNMSAIDEFVSPRFVDHSAPPGMGKDREAFKTFMGMYMSAFPDMEVKIDALMSEADFLTARVRSRGTHKGDFMGIAPTGKEFEIMEIHIVRLADGKMVEHWGLEDNLGMLTQLSIITPPGQG